MTWLPKVKVAACNASPVFLNTQKTVQKAIALIREAANNKADLVVFPETYIPAFPVWAAVAAPIDNHKYFQTLVRESLLIQGPEIRLLQRTCASLGVFAHVGFNERSEASLGCIWNSSVLIGDDGNILNHHRKIMPTFWEKLVWAPGDGAGLRVADTRIALICGEGTNPLARWSLMAQGEQLHVSTWPPIWPTTRAGADSQGPKQYDLLNANRIRTAAHSFEAKCFSVACSMFMDREMRDSLVNAIPSAAETIDNFPQAASFFMDPTGTQVGEQVVAQEGIAYAELDLNQCVTPKLYHDVVGTGYQRYDIFQVKVKRERLGPATVFDPTEKPIGKELSEIQREMGQESSQDADTPSLGPLRIL